MSWDRTWRCSKKKLLYTEVEQAAQRVAQSYKGIFVAVEQETADCITCFFTVSEDQNEQVFEISIYNLGKDGWIISLEADASDNRLSEDSDQLAEDLAAELDAFPLVL